MDMLALEICVFAACLVVVGIVTAKWYRGSLNRVLVFWIASGLVGLLGLAGMDLSVTLRRDVGAAIQTRLDAATAHSADLKQRFEANSAKMTATLQEPETAAEPASVERDQVWQNRIAVLAAETGALIAEKEALLKEIAALQADIATSAQNRDAPKFFFTFTIAGTFFFVGLLSLWNLRRGKRRAA
jgi:hypothetical protein